MDRMDALKIFVRITELKSFSRAAEDLAMPRATVAGLGLIQVPAFDVSDLLAESKLVEVMPRWRPASMPVHALYPHRKHLSPRVRVFMDWVAALINEKIID